MSRIIVTGGLGFIGSHFVNYVNENTNDEILLVDKMTYAANPNNIKMATKFLNKDICDVTLEDLGEYDYIVNFAAESHVDNSIKDGLPFVKSNVQGTFNLLEVARKNDKLIKFLHISTDEVYGDMDDFTWSPNHMAQEGDGLHPSSYYSSTKAAADLLVISANRTFGLPYLITRTCNNYGENQHHEKFVPKIIQSIKNDVEVPVYGDGNQVREWIHADDNSRAIYTLLKSDKLNQIYNIGSKETFTNNQIVKMISDILGKDVKYKYVEDRLGHDKRYSLNSSKYRNDFGEIQTINIRQWLEKIIKK